ncbi:Bacterial SH3 domain protein [Roseovarius litorisediminis]|uniref:Bacterial SH3 domain protein n=1 Tax=Roseovarius litorisediminis TaxID=1312363 RepID=A0A1Y5RB28_9RHOB|nr:SH3 domain-containing protein [Roseovarius litorisediminis]SLN12541.1 Bacterial SH3 domain protein [Roseovarius litorisediminis]
MWRFILVTFTFLAYSFYILSGGADYAPRAQSIQARAKIEHVRPVPRPVRMNVIQLAESGLPKAGATSQAITSLDQLDLSAGNRFQITLATVTAEDIAKPTVSADPVKPASITLPNTTTAIETATAAADAAARQTPVTAENPAAAIEDIRLVTGDLVNLRDGPGTQYDRVGKLTKGTEVSILQSPGNGWIELRVVETGRIGWMADWLVTATN